MDGKTQKSRVVLMNLSPCDVEALRKCLQENNGDSHALSASLKYKPSSSLAP